MKIKYACLILLFLCVSTTEFFGQKNYVKGYITKNNNDTVAGLINFRLDEQNAQSCLFKLSETTPEQIFYPGDILNYRFSDEGKYYVSHKIIIDSISRLVFLEYLVDGTMNLYYYKDSKTFLEYYFFEDEYGKMTMLEKKPDKIIKSVIHSDNEYIGVLTYLFQDYPTVRKKLSKGPIPMTYERGNMIEISKEYHKQTCDSGQECIVFANDYKKQYVDVKFSVYGGLQIMNYSLHLLLENPEYIPGPMNSTYPTIGGQVFITSPRRSKSFGLLLDIGISGIKGKHEDASGTTFPTYRKFEFEASILMGKIDAKYVYPKGKIRPSVEAGFSYFYLFNKSNHLHTERKVYEDIKIKDIDDYQSLPVPSLLGFNCGIGLDWMLKNNKSICCRISYDDVNSMKNKQAKTTYYFTNRIKAGQIKVGYTF